VRANIFQPLSPHGLPYIGLSMHYWSKVTIARYDDGSITEQTEQWLQRHVGACCDCYCDCGSSYPFVCLFACLLACLLVECLNDVERLVTVVAADSSQYSQSIVSIGYRSRIRDWGVLKFVKICEFLPFFNFLKIRRVDANGSACHGVIWSFQTFTHWVIIGL